VTRRRNNSPPTNPDAPITPTFNGNPPYREYHFYH
jgi:hypothetical protein